MIIVISCSVLAVLLTILESYGIIKGGMKLGFVLVTILAVIHYDYGSDYMAYFNLYNEIVADSFSLQNIIDGYYHNDVGWVLLNLAFSYVGGFFVLVAVLSITQNILVYKFIRSNVVKNWQPLAVLIYLFSTSFYLLNFSMLRQGLVIVVFLSLWPLIKNRRYLITLLVLFLCSLIHSSALILLPFAFWGYLPLRRPQHIAMFFIVMYLILWFAKDILNEVFNRFLVVDSFESYAKTYADDDKTSFGGPGFIINQIPFALSLFYIFKSNKTNADSVKLVSLASVGFLIMPFSQIIPLLVRVVYYFSVYSIASIPLIYKSLNNKLLRNILLALYILILIYDYWNFFHVGIYVQSYSNFKTIFSVIF